MRDLVIFGTGGSAREVCQAIEDVNAAGPTWRIVGFLDGDASRHGSELRDLPVLGGAGWAAEHPDTTVVVAIGGPAGRRAVVGELADLGVTGPERFPVVVHPTAWIGNHVRVGEGSVVLAGAAVSTDIDLGPFAALNKNCIVGHDAVLEPFVTIAPGASVSGHVRLGEGVNLGANSVVVQGRSVGAGTVVGAGAVVAEDLPARVTAVGVPARVIRRHDDV
ncbi:MAG: NeuD/PglB/VioB family sugar acetyltransferase [Solirubrobacteraceae bacterium]